MSAKQRHKQRVMKRLKDKLGDLKSAEETLHTIVKEHVSKAENKCIELMGTEDTGYFLQHYCRIEQELDGVLNFVEQLTSSAEDMIENVDHDHEDILSSDRTLLSSTQMHSSERHEVMKPVRDDYQPNKLQMKDDIMKRELTDMIQSSCRRRRSSSEAAIQTSLDEMDGTQVDNVCKLTQSTVVKNEHRHGNQSEIVTRSESLKRGLEESNIITNKQTSGKQVANDKKSENKEHTSVNSEKGSELAAGKGVGKSKAGKGVPERVKKHLNKESGKASDESASSQVDSLTFGQNVTLTSSPKGKGKESKKKKSPKRKVWKSNAERIQSHLNRNETKRVSPTSEVNDMNDEHLRKGKEETDKWRNVEPDAFKANMKFVKGESGEVSSSEPTVASSEQSILQHEITEMMATTESNESSGSGIKQVSLQTGQVVLYSKQPTDSGLSSESEPNISQKSPPNSNESEFAEHCVADKKAQGEANAGPDNSSRPTESENQTANVASKDESDSVVVKDKSSDQLLSPGSLLPGRITPVIVSEVVSPWCFFLQQNGPPLNQLMEHICMHMAQGGLNEPPILEPEIGALYLARYSKDNAFYRAYVMEIYRAIQTHSTEVDVLYVDYGNRERVKVTQLRRLPNKFKSFPTQAICCALAEVMPCNKYCVWAEDDIHMFRQYVSNQQLSCTPPTCRSSNVSHPLLVELIVSLPVPSGLQGGIYLSQFSIAKLLIKNNKARHVEVTEQLGLLINSREGAEEAAILSHNTSVTGRLAIKELSDSLCDPPAELRDQKGVQNEPCKRDNLHATSKVAGHEQETKVEEDKDVIVPKMELPDLDPGTDGISTNIKHSDNRSKHVRSDLISPRSESSDTESQKDELLKGSGKAVEKSPGSMCPVTSSSGQLDRIKEENVDLESLETASTCNSTMTDLEFPGKGVNIPDLHIDFDDLYLNPQGQEVMLAHVRSPEEFFVHIISQQYGETLDRLMKTLNSLFESANRRKLTRLSKTFEVTVNKLCCAQFLQDNNFYRGIVRSVTPEKELMKGRVLVHYIDFGDEEWLPKRRIFPLPPQFCNVPRLAVKCSLAYLRPVSAAGEPVKWSEKSVEKFVNIAGLEKTLHMHVVQGRLDDVKKGDPCVDPPVLGVMLIDNTGTEEACVNVDLISEGVAQLDAEEARPDRDSARDNTHDNALEKSPERMEIWNPMEEDFLSKRNSYNIDIDDAGVATTGYKARDEERICKFYSTGRDCWRGERCPYRHVIVESGVTYDKEPVYAITDNQAEMLPNTGSWVALEVATILSPSHFYAILPLGNKSLDTTNSEPEKSESAVGETGSEETLEDLLQALNTEYSKCPTHQGNLLLRAIGEVVVARFSMDKSWYRARVIEVTEEKVKVFFVDFGNTEWLPEDEIMDIRPEFLHLPFQAVECFMNVEPKGDEKWTKDARFEFRELVDGKTLVGQIKSRSWSGCLWVELYDTTTEEDINVGEELVKQGYALKAESQDSHTDYSSSVSYQSGDVLLVPG